MPSLLPVARSTKASPSKRLKTGTCPPFVSPFVFEGTDRDRDVIETLLVLEEQDKLRQ